MSYEIGKGSDWKNRRLLNGLGFTGVEWVRVTMYQGSGTGWVCTMESYG